MSAYRSPSAARAAPRTVGLAFAVLVAAVAAAAVPVPGSAAPASPRATAEGSPRATAEGSPRAIADAPAVIAAGDAQRRAIGVETAPVAQAGEGRLMLPAQVTLPNDQLHVVSAPLAGVVLNLAVAPGDPVRRGQVVARLGGAPILEAQRERLHADAQARLLERSARRDELLFREGIIAESRHEATRAAYVQAVALATEKRRALELAGVDVRDGSAALSGTVALRAPADGVVLEQGAAVGQRVDHAAPIYRIGRLSPIALEVQLPVAAAAQVRSGAAVRVPAVAASGRVVALGRQVSASQTVALRASIDDGADRLRPGQFVEAEVALPAPPPGTWRVPQAALVRHDGRLYVLVEVSGGFRAQPVTLVARDGDAALVGGALAADARVATRGVAALKSAWLGAGDGG